MVCGVGRACCPRGSAQGGRVRVPLLPVCEVGGQAGMGGRHAEAAARSQAAAQRVGAGRSEWGCHTAPPECSGTDCQWGEVSPGMRLVACGLCVGVVCLYFNTVGTMLA